jgi:hypothetical protein
MMNLTETVVVAVITVGVAGTAYTVMGPAALTHKAEATAAQATCQAVDAAVVAYVAERGAAPRGIGDLRPYVRGDITAYRLDEGIAVGPGCPRAAR